MTATESTHRPTLVDVVLPIVTLVVLTGGALALFGLAALDGPLQVALVLCAMVAALVAFENGHRFEDVQASAQRTVASITSAVFILFATGFGLNIVAGDDRACRTRRTDSKGRKPVSTTKAETTPAVKLTFWVMTGMVVGSMVGAGVFSLPGRFAQQTGIAGALVAWGIAGGGMLMLAFVFQTLANRKPNLDSGVYAYAKAGFGEYVGFFSAFGYWASACVGNVTYWVLIMSTIGAIWPALGDGDTVLALVLSTAGVWLFYYLIRRGVREAAMVNHIVTIAKVIPILVFVLLALFALDPAVFAANWGGGGDVGSLFEQVRGTMLVTVFVFLGVEGASVYSRHAQRREHVGRATVLGFVSVASVFASVTIVSYGIMPYSEIADLRQPSMAGVLEAAVGPWGKVLVSVGLVVSVLGAYLAWTLMAAEVLFVAAKDDDMPRFLRAANTADVPTASLAMTTILVQIMLVVAMFSGDAFNFTLDLTSALTLLPFLFAAGYALKLALTRETYTENPRGRGRELVVATLATVYTAFLLFAAGPKFILLSFVIYAPATVLFVMARREQRRRLFSPLELVILAVSVVGAVVGVVALATGALTI